MTLDLNKGVGEIMGYIVGLLKYVFKGPFTNPVAFYIFGGAILAVLASVPHFLEGNFIHMTLTYFMTKYLPPTSLLQIIKQTVLGSLVAGIKWFLLTPRL